MSEILELKIGDLTDRILDEIIYDLTPYGYKSLIPDSSINKTCCQIKQKYIKVVPNNHKAQRVMHSVNDEEQYNDDEAVYSYDIVADIVLNRHDKTAQRLKKEIFKAMPDDIMRNMAISEKYYNRRVEVLKRKTIAKSSRKIIKIVLENSFDMSVKHDDIEKYIN